jgi:hypothetical protein
VVRKREAFQTEDQGRKLHMGRCLCLDVVGDPTPKDKQEEGSRTGNKSQRHLSAGVTAFTLDFVISNAGSQ